MHDWVNYFAFDSMGSLALGGKLGFLEQGRDIDGAQESGFQDCEMLSFLCAVIQESTRLHPSVQYQLPRRVPTGGVTIGSYHLEEGTICSISPATMNRSKVVFGDDADEWMPERRIGSSEQKRL